MFSLRSVKFIQVLCMFFYRLDNNSTLKPFVCCFNSISTFWHISYQYSSAWKFKWQTKLKTTKNLSLILCAASAELEHLSWLGAFSNPFSAFRFSNLWHCKVLQNIFYTWFLNACACFEHSSITRMSTFGKWLVFLHLNNLNSFLSLWHSCPACFKDLLKIFKTLQILSVFIPLLSKRAVCYFMNKQFWGWRLLPQSYLRTQRYPRF